MSTTNPLNNGTVDTGHSVGTVLNNGTATKANDTLDKDAFLKLLVAQLKYQDPSSPADSSQMMAQSAQFSMLEALQNMAQQQTKLLNSQNTSVANGMLGQKITATAANGKDDIVGVVTGVKQGTDGPILKVGDMEVPLSSVKEVDKA